MGTRKQKKWRKIAQMDRYSVFQSKSLHHQFEVSWKKSSGSYGRRRYAAESIAKAIEDAPQVAGLLPRVELKGPGLTLAEAFAEALGESNRGSVARGDWLREQVRFMKWIDKRHSDCTHWELLTRAMIRQYLSELFVDRSPNRRRMGIQPVTQTANYMEREYNMPNVARRLGIGAKLAKPPALVYLSDVVDFLDWLKDQDPALEVGAALQGLVGLQLQEVLRLTWNKVDLDEGLIEISGEVKNEYRNRVLPVCERARESLLRAAALSRSDQVKTVADPVVRMHRGGSYAESEHGWRRYSRAVSAAIKGWNPSINWTPKDLRNCLPTFGVSMGLHNDLWEQYLGHVPKSVTGRHYVPRVGSVSRGEAAALRRQMNLFRLRVVEPVESAMVSELQEPFLKNFESEAIATTHAVDPVLQVRENQRLA